MLRKTVIVTGASGGIGSAVAKKFASAGYNVALTSHTADVSQLEAELKTAYDVECKSYPIELRNAESISSCMDQIFADFAYVDAVICNAGVAEKEMLLVDTSLQSMERVLDTNLKGTLICNQIAVKYLMQQKHGSIVNISSIYGLSGGACETIYSASKAGIIGLTKALADEAAPFGVRINAIAPGCIETKMVAAILKNARQDIIEQTPLRRIGQPEDVANAVYFLASDQASFITGECLSVTGGVVKF